MVLAAIPARFGATRFPGKPLAEILGRPMIAWVVDAARAAGRVDDVAVVTDDERVARVALAAGARAVVSAKAAASGTDRIAHLLAVDPTAGAATIVVNVQGDEPLIEPAAIDAAVGRLVEDPAADIVTLVRRLRRGEDANDPHLVKAAVGKAGRALYFSRGPIPYGDAQRIHIGLYAYRRAAFDQFAAAPPSALEEVERLEQLRALDMGLVIRCLAFDSRSIGVDTPADIARVEAALQRSTRESIGGSGNDQSG